MKGNNFMNYKYIREILEKMLNENYKDFIKAIISIEKEINNKILLDKIYDKFMKNDNINLLNEEFNYMINRFIH